MDLDRRALVAALRALGEGEAAALDRLMPLVYADLRCMAKALSAGDFASRTLQPTAVVHETYLRLRRLGKVHLRDVGHFIGLAARIMRCVLVDHARARRAQRRGAGVRPVALDEAAARVRARSADPVDVLALDAALQKLDGIDPRQSQIVQLLFFAGMTLEETAEALGLSYATVNREWRTARLWLLRELSCGETRAAPAEDDRSSGLYGAQGKA